ncbi:chromophore lyase CRL, chloroplastic isoform X2 [Cryptomeria japonica]|uniref:chromophore lyase CRL, chloroplastic isoform X2 n=1 Tax=Cryptomeria japonica TaxID=3369 RepID=UPI0025AD8C85|nr:chromophore lyase CRL, chloroplastic isoform X2 [Cryptomeria japonica]XP_057865618.1 chromophore lyase CRL, chloroplastic isoform X2 [Cryptomeria japonica]
MVEVICLHEEGGTSSSNEGSNNHNSKKGESRNGSRNIASVVVKALCVAGGFFFMRKLTKSTAPVRVDHSRIVAEALSGEKFSSEQAARDPMTYFNHRMLACPAMEMVNGSKLLYFEQAFWRTPEKPHRQRFFVVKPCPKDMKCDVEVASYAIKNIEEYRNFCARPDSQRPQSDEILGHVAEHLNTLYLSQCERGRRCLYKGSTPPNGFPNLWNGATHCTSELTIFRNGEIHCWDRAYDDEGNQVWGARQGPYEFKPVSTSTFDGP